MAMLRGCSHMVMIEKIIWWSARENNLEIAQLPDEWMQKNVR
jgi:hypothetical protein